ncbi:MULTISPECIES: hypothetical protein [Xenorhabdus]|uniref:hypothetical protein n=1 Tax=Xenorhabdus TaxID=626 RepID=UPI00068A1FD0|nr:MULTISPECIES: hypothetical protein [Xenorhabdus]MBC8947173.1 hypothetical protein [Xenorhabdus indica]
MRTFISAIIEEPTTTPKSTHHIKGIITPIVTAIVPYSEHFYLPFLAEKNNDREINNEEEFKHYLLAMYHVRQKHTEPIPCYHLEPVDGHGYGLYQRKGSYMYLMDILPFTQSQQKTKRCQ